mmetsp:Transcript_5189/g.5651  ORF Transcript_5189/g.5651 Transcript_5189/m.5651 type:complete len:90 (-) Transcript_5189:142-411(-)
MSYPSTPMSHQMPRRNARDTAHRPMISRARVHSKRTETQPRFQKTSGSKGVAFHGFTKADFGLILSPSLEVPNQSSPRSEDMKISNLLR